MGGEAAAVVVPEGACVLQATAKSIVFRHMGEVVKSTRVEDAARLRREYETLCLLSFGTDVVVRPIALVHVSPGRFDLRMCDGGVSLIDRLPPVTEARHTYEQVRQAVAHIHSMGLAHLDIKLDNLLQDAHGKVRICDVEFARHAQDGCLIRAFVGSASYAAPEVLELQPYDPRRADAWSLGIVLHGLLSHTLPFRYASAPRDAAFASYARALEEGVDKRPSACLAWSLPSLEDWSRDAFDMLLHVAPSRRVTSVAHTVPLEEPDAVRPDLVACVPGVA